MDTPVWVRNQNGGVKTKSIDQVLFSSCEETLTGLCAPFSILLDDAKGLKPQFF
jgi:hypothetical protein